MVNGCRESDSFIVSGKPSNKICDNKRMAEEVEKRRLVKGNSVSETRAGHRAGKPCKVSLIGCGRCHVSQGVCALLPEAGAQCGSSACWDLRGGCRVTGIPTATKADFFPFPMQTQLIAYKTRNRVGPR